MTYREAAAWSESDRTESVRQGEERPDWQCNIAHEMVGRSPAIRRVCAFIGRVAATNATVLIHGESGTGKELVARAIHNNSRRASGQFVAINCAALPLNLLESELFGHVRGAFTGAITEKKGKLELADGGTLFLDEIGELPLSLQAKLLRALQEREFERVGGTRCVRVNLRIVTATNIDLRDAVSRGAFRKDLYFRLDVVSLRMPPLRERREDIPLLVAHFARNHAAQQGRRLEGVSADAMALLHKYDWPGNIRELQNAVERAVVLGTSDTLQAHDLPEEIAQATQMPNDYRCAVRHFKRQLVLGTVRKSEGSMAEAARMLGVHPNYLHRLVTNLDLRKELAQHIMSSGQGTAEALLGGPFDCVRPEEGQPSTFSS